MFPRVYIISVAPREALFETLAVIFVGAIAIGILYSWQKRKQKLAELEASHKQLNYQIQRLSLLHVISNLINQPLGLKQVVDLAIDKVAQVMDSPTAWVYLWDGGKKHLKLFTSYGCREDTFRKSRLKPG
jgi:hypothetical protein